MSAPTSSQHGGVLTEEALGECSPGDTYTYVFIVLAQLILFRVSPHPCRQLTPVSPTSFGAGFKSGGGIN